jgi:hypothetical protein
MFEKQLLGHSIFSAKPSKTIIKAIWLTEGTQRDKVTQRKHTDGDERKQSHQKSENDKTKGDDGPK